MENVKASSEYAYSFYQKFYDSGIAALDAHKEELYEACIKVKYSSIAYVDKVGKTCAIIENEYLKAILVILNQIEKEK